MSNKFLMLNKFPIQLTAFEAITNWNYNRKKLPILMQQGVRREARTNDHVIYIQH